MRVAVEVDMEPILVRRVPFAFAHVAKRPEVAAHVVEHRVHDHAHASGVQGVHHVREVLVRAEAAVDLAQVARVVAVRVGGEHRVEQNRSHAEFFQVRSPFDEGAHAVEPSLAQDRPVISQRRRIEGAAEHAERIDLIERGVENPHGTYLSRGQPQKGASPGTGEGSCISARSRVGRVAPVPGGALRRPQA